MWMLLDHVGRIVRTGQEQVPHIHLRRTLEARFPGIRTEDVTIVPWRALNGEPSRDSRNRIIKVACIWLAAGSPLPDECPHANFAPIVELELKG